MEAKEIMRNSKNFEQINSFLWDVWFGCDTDYSNTTHQYKYW